MNKNNIARAIALIVLVSAIAFALSYRQYFDAAAVNAWIDDAGWGAPLVFMAIYAVATVLFLPGAVLTLVGGALFGPALGTFYNLTGATIGAILAFLVARHLASDWVAQKVGGRLKQLISGVEEEGARFVAFVRLVPLFPFNLLNYALGLTRIRLSHYAIASYVCMLPGAIAYTYLGYLGREAASGSAGLIQKSLLALGLLAAVALLPGLIRRLKKPAGLDVAGLKDRLAQNEKLLVLDVRSPEEFHGEKDSQGHIAGALNIPLSDLAARLPELEAHRQRPLAVVCRTDKRSAKAVALLKQAGYAGALLVYGGMMAWERSNFPLQR